MTTYIILVSAVCVYVLFYVFYVFGFNMGYKKAIEDISYSETKNINIH